MKLSLNSFVISDTHFSHKQVLQKEPSRIKKVKQLGASSFDCLSIALWNKAVSKDDRVLHLGDLYFKDGIKCVKKLNGKKILLAGNNDTSFKLKQLSKLKDKWKIIEKIKFDIKDKKLLKQLLAKKFGENLNLDFANALIKDIDGIRILFSHFPVNERKRNDRFALQRDIIDYAFKIAKCDINIHGHNHSRKSKHKYCINVSTEVTDFKPIRLKDLLKGNKLL